MIWITNPGEKPVVLGNRISKARMMTLLSWYTGLLVLLPRDNKVLTQKSTLVTVIIVIL